ncbi:MAG: Tex family protein [Chloroflexota bacterium]
MNHAQLISAELDLKPSQVQATIDLLDEGNTLPFIARYRKEKTGELDEKQLRDITDKLDKLRAIDERRATILKAIGDQGKLTDELQKKINTADSLTLLEDLYQPYKIKKQSRAEKARQLGVQPLADMVLAQGWSNDSLDALAKPYLCEDLPDTAAVWQAARDIVAETISDHPDIRGEVREKALKFGMMQVEKVKSAEDKKEIFQLYYDFKHMVSKLRPHQILAINRGESEKILRVKVAIDKRDWLRAIAVRFLPRKNSKFTQQLELAIQDGAARLLLPAIERDVRRTLAEKSEAHAIDVFAENLRGLLGQPPLADKIVLGLDPAYRTGCKLAIIDATGQVLDYDTIYPHQPQKQWDQSIKKLAGLVNKYNVSLISIGNGTASRESEKLVAELISMLNKPDLAYIVTNEAGASVYSASELAGDELPDLDVSIRGAVSIARRVQDPLAELVKIDPKAIGVGLYQHDVNQKQLAQTLEGVVESVVNQVGVDINSASPALLTHVSGIGPRLADNIVSYRNENGEFDSRQSLKKVSGLGPKAFEQAAGFLRVRNGGNWLDNSAIHPESYDLAKKMMVKAGIDLTGSMDIDERENRLKPLSTTSLAAELDAGVPTLTDIMEQLIRPGRDPREDMPRPILRSDVVSMDDLKVGMTLNGTVQNVVDFGCFIDIGVKKSGLLHRSKIKGDWPTVGEVLEIEIVSLDVAKGRIGLARVKK